MHVIPSSFIHFILNQNIYVCLLTAHENLRQSLKPKPTLGEMLHKQLKKVFIFFRYGGVNNDPNVRILLEALRLAIPECWHDFFWECLQKMMDLSKLFEMLSLQTWGWFFPPSSVDPLSISTRVFVILTEIVKHNEPGPSCPQCSGPMKLSHNVTKPFGWLYICTGTKQLSRKQKMAKKGGLHKHCRGQLSATHNTWIFDSNSVHVALFLTFCWVRIIHCVSVNDVCQFQFC